MAAEQVSPVAAARAATAAFAEAEGRRPRILVAAIGDNSWYRDDGGHDSHGRDRDVIAAAFADLGFDVDVGPPVVTPDDVARHAVDDDVHAVAVSSPVGTQLAVEAALRAALDVHGRPDIRIAVSGAVPPADLPAVALDMLRELSG